MICVKVFPQMIKQLNKTTTKSYKNRHIRVGTYLSLFLILKVKSAKVFSNPREKIDASSR